MEEEEKKEVSEQTTKSVHVKFAFKKPDDYRMYFVNGAYGGLTPHGDIICNFFFEYKTLPESEEAIATEDGKLTPIKSVPSESEMTRELKVGVIMTPNEAKNLAEWLLGKISEYEKTFIGQVDH